MKRVAIALGLLLLVSPALAGPKKTKQAAVIPPPAWTSSIQVADLITVAQRGVNPDPFNPKPTAEQAPPTPPAPTNNKPVVVNMPPAPKLGDGWLEWVWTLLGGIFASLFGINVLQNRQAGQVTHTSVDDVLRQVLSPGGSTLIQDPQLKAIVDTALIQIIQSGVPGKAIQTGLSAIPGVGPLAAQLEPVLRKIVLDVLAQQSKGGASAS